jgi:tetratricopeptide (TPR) repeat protein
MAERDDLEDGGPVPGTDPGPNEGAPGWRTPGPPALDPYALGRLAALHAEVAAAYVEVGLYDHAVHELRLAIDHAPSFVDLRARLACAIRDAGDPEEALSEFAAVKALNPHYLPGRVQLGLTLYVLGRTDEAAAEWREVLALDPDDRSARAYLRLVDGAPGER